MSVLVAVAVGASVGVLTVGVGVGAPAATRKSADCDVVAPLNNTLNVNV